MMINNARGRTNHVVYYDPVEEAFLPLCRGSRGLNLEEGLETRKYILSKSPVDNAEICRSCVGKMLDDDLVDLDFKFDRHLIKKMRYGRAGREVEYFAERGKTHKEYALKVNTEGE